jgi:hypothetical protein
MVAAVTGTTTRNAASSPPPPRAGSGRQEGASGHPPHGGGGGRGVAVARHEVYVLWSRGEARAEHVGDVPSEEPGDALVGRAPPDLRGWAHLFDAAVVHHDEPVGERECLAVVVGDEQHRQLQPEEQRA